MEYKTMDKTHWPMGEEKFLPWALEQDKIKCLYYKPTKAHVEVFVSLGYIGTDHKFYEPDYRELVRLAQLLNAVLCRETGEVAPELGDEYHTRFRKGPLHVIRVIGWTAISESQRQLVLQAAADQGFRWELGPYAINYSENNLRQAIAFVRNRITELQEEIDKCADPGRRSEYDVNKMWCERWLAKFSSCKRGPVVQGVPVNSVAYVYGFIPLLGWIRSPNPPLGDFDYRELAQAFHTTGAGSLGVQTLKDFLEVPVLCARSRARELHLWKIVDSAYSAAWSGDESAISEVLEQLWQTYRFRDWPEITIKTQEGLEIVKHYFYDWEDFLVYILVEDMRHIINEGQLFRHAALLTHERPCSRKLCPGTIPSDAPFMQKYCKMSKCRAIRDRERQQAFRAGKPSRARLWQASRTASRS